MTTSVLYPPASQGGVRAALESLRHQLETLLMHLRSDFENQEVTSDSHALEKLASRTIRVIAEGDERAAVVRKELDTRGSETNERETILTGRVAALADAKERLEKKGDVRVVWLPPAVGVVLVFAATGVLADIVLKLGTGKSIALSVGSAIFGLACAYAMYAFDLCSSLARGLGLVAAGLLAGSFGLALARNAGIPTLSRVVITAAAVALAAVGFGVTDGALRTEAERQRRRLLLDTSNAIAAAVNELERVLPDEKAWIGSLGDALIEIEESHYRQAYENFLSAASHLISQADLATRKELERRRDTLQEKVNAAIDAHLRRAIRPGT
jgi:hypothetical protein